MLGLRSSPRKRLQLNDTKEPLSNMSPDKNKKVIWNFMAIFFFKYCIYIFHFFFLFF